MTFSEDPSSPAAPFSGDSSGQIFDLPDMVANSPTTSERVVDTQSGFLVVIKRLNDRLALSVKRRIGTPPSSSISLTPDESVKLSRILSTSFTVAEEYEWDALDPAERTDRRGAGDRRREDRRRRRANSAAQSNESSSSILDEHTNSSRDAQNQTGTSAKVLMALALRRYIVPILGVSLSVFALGIGAGVTGLKLVQPSETKATVQAVSDPLDSKKVDSFTRDFVGKLLDFSSATYRVSQVQAMASMSPDLLERYWKETKFPLTKKQLAGLPQGASIMIAELKQERVDANNVQVDVRAQFSDAKDPKIATPVNLRLKLTADPNKQIVVTDQQDLSSPSSN